jgi:protease IV
MKEKRTGREKLFAAIKIIALIWIISSIAALFFAGDRLSTGNVAVVPVYGIITATTEGGFATDYLSSDSIIRSLKRAEENPAIKAILLDINSPGGSAVGTDEIAQEIKRINKPTVAVIRESGASGAYWIATSSDYVFANRLSIVGSIGVTASFLEFSGFLERYNVTYQRYVAGDLKDMGSPFREPTEEESRILQQLVDQIRVFFIDEVAQNRNMSYERVEELARGQIFLGSEARELGLVDDLGTKEDALRYIEKELNISASPVVFRERRGFFEVFSGVFSDTKIGKFINPFSPSLI